MYNTRGEDQAPVGVGDPRRRRRREGVRTGTPGRESGLAGRVVMPELRDRYERRAGGTRKREKRRAQECARQRIDQRHGR